LLYLNIIIAYSKKNSEQRVKEWKSAN